MLVFVGSLPALLSGCSALLTWNVDPEHSVEACNDGRDNDLDGATDCDDPECAGLCIELGPGQCADRRDNDGNGVIDHRDVTCWEHSAFSVDRCASLGPISLDERSFGPGYWRGTYEFGSIGTRPALDLGGGAHAVLLQPLFGGGELSMTLELELSPTPGSAVSLTLAREEDVRVGPPSTWYLDIIGVMQVFVSRERCAPSEVGVRVSSWREGGEHHCLEDADGPLRLHIVGRTALVDGSPPPPGEPRMRMEVVIGNDAGSTVIPAADLAAPPSWSDVSPLVVALEGRGEAGHVAPVAAERDRGDPCGYRVPQFQPGSRVMAAAVDRDGRVCAIGTTGVEESVEAVFDPYQHRGWPRRVSSVEDPARNAEFAWWWSVAPVEPLQLSEATWQSDAAGALPARYLRAAALAWASDLGRFEGVALLSDQVRGGGELFRITSSGAACGGWVFEPLPELRRLSREERSPSPDISEHCHPPLTWAEGSTIPDRPTPPDSAVPLSYQVDDDGRRVLLAGLPDEAGLRIQSVAERNCNYPRAGLAIVTWSAADALESIVEPPDARHCPSAPLDSALCLPAFQPNSLDAVTPVRSERFPARPTQLFTNDRDGTLVPPRVRVAVLESTPGIRLLVSREPIGQRGDDVARRSELILQPSAIPTTFDEREVRDPILVFPRQAPGATSDSMVGLLFYRGYSTRTVDGELVGLGGGRAAVVPVRFQRVELGTVDRSAGD